ncbi:hypothetical protein FQA39_LY14041 [Lamprigera yunnana]|nr:hypothetical protein FQA39_LY14041 [Lamprigera yunnana]
MDFHLLIVILSLSTSVCARTEEDEGVKYANKCEVCKILATELEERLKETGKSHDVLETGYALDDVKPKKKTEYHKSELRFIESLEGVCDRILEYNIHKEREDSTRFAKGMSQTFQTLHGLVDKGVKVELGIPYELWDKPSAEVTNMKTQCETVLEQNENALEDWYWNYQHLPLKDYLCRDRFLKGDTDSCLDEVVQPKKEKKKKAAKKELKLKIRLSNMCRLKSEIIRFLFQEFKNLQLNPNISDLNQRLSISNSEDFELHDFSIDIDECGVSQPNIENSCENVVLHKLLSYGGFEYSLKDVPHSSSADLSEVISSQNLSIVCGSDDFQMQTVPFDAFSNKNSVNHIPNSFSTHLCSF